MAEPAAPPPRQPDVIKGDLRRLHQQRAEAQDQLSNLLTTITAITDVIDVKVAELARALNSH